MRNRIKEKGQTSLSAYLPFCWNPCLISSGKRWCSMGSRKGFPWESLWELSFAQFLEVAVVSFNHCPISSCMWKYIPQPCRLDSLHAGRPHSWGRNQLCFTVSTKPKENPWILAFPSSKNKGCLNVACSFPTEQSSPEQQAPVLLLVHTSAQGCAPNSTHSTWPHGSPNGRKWLPVAWFLRTAQRWSPTLAHDSSLAHCLVAAAVVFTFRSLAPPRAGNPSSGTRVAVWTQADAQALQAGMERPVPLLLSSLWNKRLSRRGAREDGKRSI